MKILGSHSSSGLNEVAKEVLLKNEYEIFECYENAMKKQSVKVGKVYTNIALIKW